MSVAANASQSRGIQLRHQPVKLATITAAISASRTYSATPPSCSCADSCSSHARCRRYGRVLNRVDGSFEIAPDDADDFFGRFLLFRSRLVLRIEDVELDMVFDDFRHERIHRASARSHRQKNGRAFMLRQQGFFDRVKLSADAPNTMQQFRFVSNCVSLICRSYRMQPNSRYLPPPGMRCETRLAGLADGSGLSKPPKFYPRE